MQATQREAIGRAVATFLKVLLGDVVIIPIALFWLMGDSAEYQHDYSPEQLKAATTLLMYVAVVLSVGLHGHFAQRRTARLLVIAFGLVPTILLALRLIWPAKTTSF